jgi:hypothetical protein
MQNLLSSISHSKPAGWPLAAGGWVGRVSRLLPAHAGEHLDRWMHTGGEKRFIEPEKGDVPQQEKDE